MSDIAGAPVIDPAATAAAAQATADAVAAATKATADAAAAKATADAAATKVAEDAAAAEAAAKAKEDGTPAKADDGKADDAGMGAPDTYEDFTLPEGMEVDKVALEAFLPLAKSLNLSQEQAQQLVSLQMKQVEAAAEAQQTAWDTVQDEWRTATKADKDIGGTNLTQTLAHAKTFLSKFASPGLLQLLDDTGVGNHVEAIRLFAMAGKAMGEDSLISGSTSPPVKTQAAIMFPDQNQ